MKPEILTVESDPFNFKSLHKQQRCNIGTCIYIYRHICIRYLCRQTFEISKGRKEVANHVTTKCLKGKQELALPANPTLFLLYCSLLGVHHDAQVSTHSTTQFYLICIYNNWQLRRFLLMLQISFLRAIPFCVWYDIDSSIILCNINIKHIKHYIIHLPCLSPPHPPTWRRGRSAWTCQRTQHEETKRHTKRTERRRQFAETQRTASALS